MTGVVLDRDTAQAVMDLHPNGARLVLRTGDGRVYRDIACSIGFQWGQAPAFAYAVPRQEPPFATGMRFFVTSVRQRGDVCFIGCRDERDVQEVEIHHLTPDEHAAVRTWMESVPDEALAHVEELMRSLLHPAAL